MCRWNDEIRNNRVSSFRVRSFCTMPGVRKTKIGSEQGEPQKNGPRKKVFLVIWGKGWYTATDNLIMGDAIFVVTPRGKRGGRRSS